MLVAQGENMRWLTPLFCLSCFAYNPPSDTAGPVTVSLQAPASGNYGAGGFVELSRPGVPFTVPVSLRNASDREIAGTIRVVVIDHWTVTPAGAVPFRLAPHGRLLHPFTVSFGPGTLNAHYPIHAYAQFDDQGQKLTAHPVLILETRIPDLARPKLPAEWKAVALTKGGTLWLWRMPVRRESAEIGNVGVDAGRGDARSSTPDPVSSSGRWGDAKESA